jgi:hypothetical protein
MAGVQVAQGMTNSKIKPGFIDRKSKPTTRFSNGKNRVFSSPIPHALIASAPVFFLSIS